MPKYRVFTNDCGPNRYSCLDVIEAKSQRNAVSIAARKVERFAPVKMVVMPDGLVSTLFVGDEPEGGRFKSPAISRYGYVIK